MARITIRLPDDTLTKLDSQRGLTPRSTLINKLLEYVAEQPGYLKSFCTNV